MVLQIETFSFIHKFPTFNEGANQVSTLKDIAEHVGVSVSAVSRVIKASTPSISFFNGLIYYSMIHRKEIIQYCLIIFNPKFPL